VAKLGKSFLAATLIDFRFDEHRMVGKNLFDLFRFYFVLGDVREIVPVPIESAFLIASHGSSLSPGRSSHMPACARKLLALPAGAPNMLILRIRNNIQTVAAKKPHSAATTFWRNRSAANSIACINESVTIWMQF
jgi:hypothetical protein